LALALEVSRRSPVTCNRAPNPRRKTVGQLLIIRGEQVGPTEVMRGIPRHRIKNARGELVAGVGAKGGKSEEERGKRKKATQQLGFLSNQLPCVRAVKSSAFRFCHCQGASPPFFRPLPSPGRRQNSRLAGGAYP
jgi:hypothetical protein